MPGDTKPETFRAPHSDEIYTRERCFITELMNHPSAPDASLALCRVEPGVTTELHRLSVREWYIVRTGAGMMELGGGAPFDIGPGDCVAIAAGQAQRVTNTGDSDLIFECLCLPRFTPACYEPLEDGDKRA